MNDKSKSILQWKWIISVLKTEKEKQKYSQSMFPQIADDISKSIDALTDVIKSCEFRMNQQSIITIPYPINS